MCNKIKSSLLITAAILILQAGCAAKARFSEVPRTFLEDVDVSKRLDNLPFQHSWVWKKDLKRDDYDAIYLPPVRIDKLPADAWMQSMSAWITSREDYLREAKALAQYFHQRLREEISKQSGHRFRLVNKPGPKVVVMQVALTGLEFSHPAVQAGSLASPVPGTSVAVSAVSEPHAAFAARLVDGGSGQLLATVADRKFPPLRVVDLNKFTVTSSAREICSNWSEMVAESIVTRGRGQVEARGQYSIMPW